MRLEMGVEGEDTMCERFCVCEHANAHPRVNVYQDPDAHEEMVDELGLMLIERRRCNKVTLEHMRLHQTNGRCPGELISQTAH